MPGTTPHSHPRPRETGAPDHPSAPRTARRRARRRRRTRLLRVLAAAGALGAAVLFVGVGEESGDGGAGASAGKRKPDATAGQGHTRATDSVRRADGRSTPSPEGSGTGTAKGSRDSAGDTPEKTPEAGNGVFHSAQASGRVVGTGTVRRYEVQVEEGTGVSPGEAAREIAGILADRRSWIADGHDAFQLVSQGTVDFVVKIATPATVDRICGASGSHARGEANCEAGSQAVVSLTRWNEGSPQFPGPIHEYRALIVNHGVGHRIGHGHEACPGPGEPAPAMMRQMDGLHGCVANAWPYDARGHYLQGPAAP
ncbi:DUF3152 domain-containing protein [Streptomyces sp. NPDC015220]|uniref:DUF3152 domain-containing protein n=1 Tax=Streptomyces sp. NPDC015220 TaxID=3364947 RepID=UPI003703445A